MGRKKSQYHRRAWVQAIQFEPERKSCRAYRELESRTLSTNASTAIVLSHDSCFADTIFFRFFGTLEFPSRIQDCDAVCCCARAAGRTGMVLSQSRAETRTPGRHFTASAVWNRMSIAEVAIPQADAARTGMVCRGDVSRISVCEIQLFYTASRR